MGNHGAGDQQPQQPPIMKVESSDFTEESILRGAGVGAQRIEGVPHLLVGHGGKLQHIPMDDVSARRLAHDLMQISTGLEIPG